MAQKWINIWGKDFKRGCLYQIIAIAIVVPLFAACILLPFYFANRPGVSQSQFLLITIIPAGLFLLALFGGGFGFLFWSLRSRAAWMDAVFAPLGLEGSRYAGTGRQYHGKIGRRKADVLFLRGPMLSIYIHTDTLTRAAFADTEDVSQNLAGLFNKTALDWGSSDLTVYTHEDNWGRRFISEPEVQSLLRSLIFDESPFYIQQVLLEPGYILLRLYRTTKLFGFKIPPEQGQRWVTQLVRLAELAEAQDAPEEALSPSVLSDHLRQGKAVKWAWLVVGMIVLMSVCVGVFALGLIFLLEGGL